MINLNNIPRAKRCRQDRRLAIGREWMKIYNGKNFIKGYAKHFGVDKICAIKELEMLGVEITEERKKQIIDAHNRLIRERKKRKEEKAKQEVAFYDFDEDFAFIAGYTANGVPFGITWEQQNQIDVQDDSFFCFDENVSGFNKAFSLTNSNVTDDIEPEDRSGEMNDDLLF